MKNPLNTLFGRLALMTVGLIVLVHVTLLIIVDSERGQLDATQVFDIRTLVELACTAGGWIADEESDRAAVLGTEWSRAQSVDDDPLLADRLQGDRDVEIVAIRVERQVVRVGVNAGLLQDRVEFHTIPTPRGMEAGHIAYVRGLRQGIEVGAGQVQGPLDRTVNRQDHVITHRDCPSGVVEQ